MLLFAKRSIAAMMATALLASAASPALAATATATITVTASVLQTCNVSASPLAFGNYDPTSATPTDGTTTVSVTCTNGTTYNVGLSAGGGTGATVSSRKLTNGGDTLNYSLYTSAARSTVWGNTIGVDTVAGTGSGVQQSLTVYGRIPAQQAALAGSYTDSVTVTVTY